MAGVNPQMVIRIAANVEELKKNLATGRDAIEALGPSAAKLQADWKRHSAQIVQDAHNITAGLQGIGPATLTAGDSASAIRKLDAAMAQLRTAGQPIPPLMAQTAAELRRLHPELDKTAASSHSTGGAMSSLRSMLGPLLAMFSTTAVIQFGKDLMNVADQLVKMRDKTGISVEGLQRLETAALQGGNTLDDVTTAIAKMQVNLAGGDKSVVNALQQMGLSLDAIRKLSPEQQFVTIGKAIEQIGDPADKAKARVLLFGRAGNEIAGTLAQDFASIAASAGGMSTKTAEALDAAGDRIAIWWRNLKGASANMLVAMYDTYKAATDQWALSILDAETTLYRHVSKMAVIIATPLALMRLPGAETLVALSKEYAQASETAARGAGRLRWELEQQVRAGTQAGESLGRLQKPLLDFGKDAQAAKDVSLDEYLASIAVAAGAAAPKIANLNGLLVGLGTATTSVPLPFLGWDMGQTAISGFAALPTVAKPAALTAGTALGDSLMDGMKGILKTAPSTIAAAFIGGGSVGGAFNAIGAEVGSTLGKSISANLAKSFGGTLGSALGSMIPVVGSFLGPAIEWIGNKIFKTEGKKVNDLRDAYFSAAGGFVALHQSLIDANAEGAWQQLWTAKDIKTWEAGVRAADAALAAHAAAVTQAQENIATLMDANAAKIDAVNQKYADQADAVKGVLKSLDDELQALNESEAPEEVMGVIEAQTRERIALEKKRNEEKLKLIEEERKKELETLGLVGDGFDGLFKDTVSASAEAALAVAEHWRKAPWSDWPVPGAPTIPVPGYAGGTHGQFVDFGASTLVALHGRERVVTERESSSASGGDFTVTVPVYLDAGTKLTDLVIKKLGKRLSVVGAR